MDNVMNFRFGLSIRMKYFNIGLFWFSISGFSLLYIYVCVCVCVCVSVCVCMILIKTLINY